MYVAVNKVLPDVNFINLLLYFPLKAKKSSTGD